MSIRKEYVRQLQRDYEIAVEYCPRTFTLFVASPCRRFIKTAQVFPGPNVESIAEQLIEIVAGEISDAAN